LRLMSSVNGGEGSRDDSALAEPGEDAVEAPLCAMVSAVYRALPGNAWAHRYTATLELT
jgi:hypothetical protein